MRRSLAAALLAVLVTAAVGHADDGPQPVVRYEQDRLTVRVVAMPLPELLDRLASASGATVRGTVPDRTVTATIEAAPLAEGLATILGAQSFALKYGGGSLRAIELLAAGDAVMPTAAPSPGATAMPGPLADEEAQARILQRPVPVGGALAAAVGSDTPTIGRLLHAVVRERDGGVRAEAREALLGALAGDPEAEAAYLSTLTPVDDAVLADMLRTSSAEDGAVAWMAALATRARSPELRAKAAAVLTLLEP